MTADPPFQFTAQPSGDGHFLHITPTGFLPPGRTFTLRVDGRLDRRRPLRHRGRHDPLPHRARANAAARRCAGATPSGSAGWPSRCRRSSRASTRSASTPTRWPSARSTSSNGKLLLWAVSTKPGTSIADRRGAFAFPLQGRYRDDSLLLSQRGLTPHVLVRRRAAAPLRPAHADGRRPARPRRQPDRRGVLPRGAGLRPGADGDRPLQQRRRSCPRAARSSPAPTAGRPTGGRRACAWRASSCDRAGAGAAAGGRLAGGAPLRRRPPRGCDPARRTPTTGAVVSLDYRKAISLKLRARLHPRGAPADPRRARPCRHASGRTSLQTSSRLPNENCDSDFAPLHSPGSTCFTWCCWEPPCLKD